MEALSLQEMELKMFDETYEKLRKELTSFDDDELRDAKLWFDKVLQYNVPHGKKNRGLAVSQMFVLLASKNDLTEENIELSRIVGWCIEFMHANALIIDDIMDQSVTRRSRPCWYRQVNYIFLRFSITVYPKPNVGFMALNDAMLLRSAIYETINKHCSGHPMQHKILDMFLVAYQNSEYGQCLDGLTTQEGSKPDFSLFTASRYAAIVKYKTSLYSFDLPVRLAMYLAEITDEKVHEKVTVILLRIGHLFQVQDDYLDCYGDPEVIGKIGTDIENGKCSWLAVEAFKRLNCEQKKIFTENYGIETEDSVKIIKDIYNQLHLQNIFKEYEAKEFNEICKMIEEFEKTNGKEVNAQVFFKLLDWIYKREK
ncbi:isoprenyl diphosphate synthase-like protein [Dinothrombium tinctorium]|uniref:Farnesyl pyrophosphate synthase n=1 Tax=Dinothrombium tinctorium TaxID=1965070 RepID=A0A3S3NRJ7_9ACAR|nr:isoprenyl diphosphate synthase-like protein [Dinothrombium tinctorium]